VRGGLGLRAVVSPGSDGAEKRISEGNYRPPLLFKAWDIGAGCSAP